MKPQTCVFSFNEQKDSHSKNDQIALNLHVRKAQVLNALYEYINQMTTATAMIHWGF